QGAGRGRASARAPGATNRPGIRAFPGAGRQHSGAVGQAPPRFWGSQGSVVRTGRLRHHGMLAARGRRCRLATDARRDGTTTGGGPAMKRPGLVYLVGAGPGDPKLITVRGLECLRRADVVVYDRLVSDALLYEAPSSSERIYAGKA